MADTVDNFVHLHVHSEYSLLDGLGRIKNLVKEAKRLGQPALALTDHGVMHGAVEFFRACKDGGIKPLIGVESYQTTYGRPMGGRDSQFDKDYYHLLLLAKDMTGYHNLLKIATRSQLEGYYYKPRVDHDFLAKHSAGLIASTGCLGAEVPNLLLQGKEREAYERLGWYVDIFGKENFFVEIQEHSIPELIPVNKQLIPWADKFGLQLVVTNDVHYVRAEDGLPHEVLLCVQTGTTMDSPKRMKLSDHSYFVKSRAQMEETFRPLFDLPSSAYDHTLQIMEMCNVDLEDPTYHLPDLPIPEGHTYDSYIRELTEDGMARLYGERAQSDALQERKERELRVIAQMGFSVYFLIVADLCRFARTRNIWWNVRGSGAGSLVAYCIGITGLDPLKNNLIFERFLNPGRVSMPDFDMDFPDDQREEMIRYTVEKYGEDRVAQIATFNRMKAKAAVRDVGRAQGIELAKVDKLAKLIPGIPGKPVTIQDCLTEGHEFYSAELVQMYQTEEWVRHLLDTAQRLEGVARNPGVHAAAVIVSDRELSHYTPLMRGSKTTVTSTIAQYEFPILESIGLLKVDFLGLSTLSVMREAGKLIKERHGIELNLQNIPFEGEPAKEAFKLLSSGEVSGVFQVESEGMRRVLTQMKPTMFEHIIAMISLYRPGPLEYIPQFIRRMHGEEPVEYKHPKLEEILAETYGILVYQEQIIQSLSSLAGYTPGEADLVRRAISKKKASDIEKHKKLFIAGCGKNDIDAGVAEAIYNDIEFFARYGFNKSHAADYAVITVQTAYLKAHYPVEYMAAQLLVERDKTEKVTNFITECRRMGIDVLPPDVNYSGLDFEIQLRPPNTAKTAQRDPSIAYNFPIPEGSAIRFGMAAIKNVGEGPVQVIRTARQEGGTFANLEDFCDRVDLRQVNKRAMECLIKAGCFDQYGERNALLAVIELMVANSAGTHESRDTGQLSIFDLFGGDGGANKAQAAAIKLPAVEPAKGKEKLQWEKELLGVYSISHPLNNFGAKLQKVVTCSCSELDERYDGKTVVLGGMISGIRTITTKKGDPMAFVQLEDLQGSCEVVFFPKTYAELKEKLQPDQVLIIYGKAQAREGKTSLLADGIKSHIDEATAVSETVPSSIQKPLLDTGPTFNGQIYDNDSSMDDFMPSSESSPFAGDMPTWVNDAPPPPLDDDGDPDGEEAPPPVLNGLVRVRPDIPPTPKSATPAPPAEAAPATAKATPLPSGTKPAALPASAAATPAKTAPPPVAAKPAAPPPALAPAKPAPTAKPKSLPEPSAVWYDFDARADKKAAEEEEEARLQESKAAAERAAALPPEVAQPEQVLVALNSNDKGDDLLLPDAAPDGDPATLEPGKAGEEEISHRRPQTVANGRVNGHNGNGHYANGNGNGNGRNEKFRLLRISLRRTGDLERDKYRLKQIYDAVLDPRGRDHFVIRLMGEGQNAELAFPNDGCTINEKLLGELTKHLRVEVAVEE